MRTTREVTLEKGHRGNKNASVKYTQMLLEADEISRWHNILAGLSTWIILASYIVFPTTFSKFQKNKKLEEMKEDNANHFTEMKMKALRAVKNIPLLAIASTCCAIGLITCFWLVKRHYRNYIWVINRIFLPTALHSVAGLVSTLVNIYAMQDGQISVTAKTNLIITSLILVGSSLFLLAWYMFKLHPIKRKHEKFRKEMKRVGRGTY